MSKEQAEKRSCPMPGGCETSVFDALLSEGEYPLGSISNNIQLASVATTLGADLIQGVPYDLTAVLVCADSLVLSLSAPGVGFRGDRLSELIRWSGKLAAKNGVRPNNDMKMVRHGGWLFEENSPDEQLDFSAQLASRVLSSECL